MKVFKVKYKNQTQMDYFYSQYDAYLKYMGGNDLMKHYPELYKVLVKTKSYGALIKLLSFVRDNINQKATGIECYHSLATFSNELELSRAQLNKKINLFGYLGFLRKLKDSELNESLKEQLNQNRVNKNRKYRSNVYEFCILGVELLEFANEKAKAFLEHNLTLNTLSYEGIARSFGKNEANEMFPQDIDKNISSEHDVRVMKITRKICEGIQDKGWTTQQEVMDSVNFEETMSASKKREIFKIAIKQILDDYELEYVQLTKEMKIELEITETDLSEKSFPKVIRKKLK